MKHLRIAVLSALFIATPAFALDPLPLTPEQQKKADLLGAIDSPVAFVSGCEMTSDASGKMEGFKGSKADRQTTEAVLALTQIFCAGMVRAVAETVNFDSDYNAFGNHKVCISPDLSIAEALKHLSVVARKNPDMLHTEDLTTAGFILYSLRDMHPCPN